MLVSLSCCRRFIADVKSACVGLQADASYDAVVLGGHRHKGKELVRLYKRQASTRICASILPDHQHLSSDLVPGIYEGGLKLWEGAVDLLSVLAGTYATAACAAHEITDSYHPLASDAPEPRLSLAGSRVLELGCGHGLPGIFALIGGANVTFHVRLSFQTACALRDCACCTHPRSHASLLATGRCSCSHL